MKTVLKLAVVLAILNAATRGAMATWTYYELRDATEQLLLVDAKATVAELADTIVDKASDLDLTVAPENVSVRREGPRTWASVAYTQPVEFFPTYTYPVRYSFTVEATNELAVPQRRTR